MVIQGGTFDFIQVICWDKSGKAKDNSLSPVVSGKGNGEGNGNPLQWERILEKEMATHSCVLAWRIPETGEPSGLLSIGSHRVGHDWSDLAAAAVSGKKHFYRYRWDWSFYVDRVVKDDSRTMYCSMNIGWSSGLGIGNLPESLALNLILE